MIRWLLLVVILLAPTPALAQGFVSFGPVHHSYATVAPTSGTTILRPAFNRRLLVLINDSANVVYCTVDGQTAAASEGIRLAAAGTTGDRVFFDRHVPQDALRCYSGTANSRVLIIEGR